MAYQQGMQRGMQGMEQRPAAPQRGQMRQQRPAMPRSPAPMFGQAGMRPPREPTVGQSLATRSAGLGTTAQEDDFLANLGLSALRSAYQMDLDRGSRVEGTRPPPTPGRMENFQQGMRPQRPPQRMQRPQAPQQRQMGQMQRPQQRQMSQFAQLGQQPMMQQQQQQRPFFNAPQMPQYGGFGSMPPAPPMQFNPMMQQPGQFSQFGGGMMQAPMTPYQ